MLILILVIVLVLIGIIFLFRHSSGPTGQCVFVTLTNGQHTCNCQSQTSKATCDSKQGIFDLASSCTGDFLQVCKTKILGSCLTSSTCTSQTLQSECVSGTWTVGGSCPTR